MNILDENVPEQQRQLLSDWHVSVRQVSHDIGRKGMQDEEIIPTLLTLGRPTFFTLDVDFFKRGLCHARYCLVFLDIVPGATAIFVRRLLRHPKFDTQAKRAGTVIRISSEGLSVWRLYATQETRYSWIGADGRALSSALREDEGLYVVADPELQADLGPDQG